MADAFATLETDADATEAWGLFQRIFTRLTFDAHAVPVVLHKLAGERHPDDFADLMERFSILYDVLCPPQDTTKEKK